MEAARRQLALMQEPDAGAVAPKSPAREGTCWSRIGRERAGFSDTQPFPLDADDNLPRHGSSRPERPRLRPAAEPPPAAEAGNDGFESTQHFAHSVPLGRAVRLGGRSGRVGAGQPQRHVDVPPASQALRGCRDAARRRAQSTGRGSRHRARNPAGCRPHLIVGLPGTAPAGLIRIVEGAGFRWISRAVPWP